MSAKMMVYDPSVDFEVVVYYDVIDDGDQCLVSVYDNNCRFLCLHSISSVTFRKAPEYWVSQVCRQHFEGEDDVSVVEGARPNCSPIIAACRDNGEQLARAKQRLIDAFALEMEG